MVTRARPVLIPLDPGVADQMWAGVDPAWILAWWTICRPVLIPLDPGVVGQTWAGVDPVGSRRGGQDVGWC